MWFDTTPDSNYFKVEVSMFFREEAKPVVKDGDTRVITKFCLVPNYVLNGWFWLESITIEQEAFNMYYEASHWVQWTTTKLITQT